MPIQCAESDEQILACHAVMAELRPHVKRDDFVGRVRLQQREGYRLAFVAEYDTVVACAGFRIGHNLAWGKYLYVDDLVSAGSVRSAGHGGRLMDWLEAHARESACDELHLDSGVQRFAAHRFYLRRRMDISSHHFVLRLR